MPKKMENNHKMYDAIVASQGILAAYLSCAKMSKSECISQLLGILDDQKLVVFLKQYEKEINDHTTK